MRALRIVRTTCLSLVLAGVCLAVLSGCARQAPGQGRHRSEPASKAIVVVRTIEDATNPVAKPGGGQLAYLAWTDNFAQAHMLDTWDATASVPVGEPADSHTDPFGISFTKEGLLRVDAGGIYLRRWAKPEVRISAVGTVADLWACPSGARVLRLHVDEETGRARNSVLDTSSGRDSALPLPAGVERISDAQWVSDRKAYVLCADEDGGSTAYSLTLSGRKWQFADPEAVIVCPAPSPDGRFLATVDLDGQLVLLDQESRQQLASWAPVSSQIEYGHGLSHLAWPDSTHVAVGIRTDSGNAVVVLDVSAVVK